MIQFEKFILANGLRVIVHQDLSTPMAVMNILYDVGARDENPERTGFAHLFEHLMFGGSVNIPDYDEPLQRAGGENNAYTTNDLTNYYIQLPAENLETAFWLESDRMLSLAFSEKSLDTQRKVVCEEFKEHYLNKPYGDVGFKIRDLAYKQHPYKWMTIGKELSHIENAKLEDDLVVDVAQRRAAVIAMIQYIRDEAATLSASDKHLAIRQQRGGLTKKAWGYEAARDRPSFRLRIVELGLGKGGIVAIARCHQHFAVAE